MTATSRHSWHRLRRRLRDARFGTGLATEALARISRISRATINRIENGTSTPHIDTAISYAHAVGLEIAAVPPHLAHLLELDHADVTAVLRAAQAAADGHRLNPLQARRIGAILGKILPRPEAP